MLIVRRWGCSDAVLRPAAARTGPPDVATVTTGPHSGELPAEDDPWADVTIGIIATLPVEAAAMITLIGSFVTARFPQDPSEYRIGHLPSSDPVRPHRVVLTTMPEAPVQQTRTSASTSSRGASARSSSAPGRPRTR